MQNAINLFNGSLPTIYLTLTNKSTTFYVYTTDRIYYLYNTAIDKIRKANGNPFAELVLTYTNIRSGLGVMAGYNQSRIMVKVN